MLLKHVVVAKFAVAKHDVAKHVAVAKNVVAKHVVAKHSTSGLGLTFNLVLLKSTPC